MRIAYVVPWSERLDAGVMKSKVDVQTRHWERARHDVRVFVLRRAEERTPVTVADGDRHVVAYHGMAARLDAVRRLFAAVRAWRPSVVYARYDLWWPSLPMLARHVPVVVEVNTDDVVEQRLACRMPRRAFNRATRRFVLSACAGLVFVTSELAHSPRFAMNRGPSAVIANSIELAGIDPCPAQQTSVRIAFLGTGEPWQGIDHVLRLATLCPEWEFDLIGVSAADVRPVPPNVHCHGFLSTGEYEPILCDANVAVGSLGLYRNGLHEASPLKVREYLAYGLPTIIGYGDTDFPDGAPFLLQIPNEASGVDRSIDAIRAFVLEWRQRRVDRSSIGHIDVSAKEDRRLEFFSDVVSAHGGVSGRGHRK
jgi:hypothetical protein